MFTFSRQDHNLTFPVWLFSYLAEAGGNLLKATKTGTDKGNPETVRDAFGFNLGRGTSPFTNYLTTEKYIEVALATPEIIKNIKNGKIKKLRGQSLNEIIASKMHVSVDTVKKIRQDKKIKQMLGI